MDENKTNNPISENNDSLKSQISQDAGNANEAPKNDYTARDPQVEQFFRPEMMETDSLKRKRLSSTYILLVIFIILLGISYFIRGKSSQNNSNENKRIYTNFEAKDIDKVEIKQSNKTTVIEKRESVWKVNSANEFNADQQAVNSLIEQSLNLNKDVVASENKDKKENFDVDDEKGINVKLFKSGEEKANFYVGKVGTDFDSTYIRLANEDTVYLSRGYVRHYFDKEDWRDLKIYSFASEKTVKLALKYRDIKNNVEMSKKDNKWLISYPQAKEAKASSIDSILNSLGDLTANDVENQKNSKECGLNNPQLVIRLELEDGSKINLLIGQKSDDTHYYVKREGENAIFVVSQGIIENLMKKIGDF